MEVLCLFWLILALGGGLITFLGAMWSNDGDAVFISLMLMLTALAGIMLYSPQVSP